MKKSILTIILGVLLLPVRAFIPEMNTITLSDGEKIITRLCMPEEAVSTIVIAIHGTGPNTYLNKRSRFNYYDVLAKGFCDQGLAFFSYNRRGVDIGDTPPMFEKIDSVKYAKYLPSTEAGDVEMMVSSLKKDERFKNCKIILYGLSEGTIIASMVAERQKVKIDALFLHGYAHENMFDIIEWQNNGQGFMVMLGSIFDKNRDKLVSCEEYESDNSTISAYRKYLFNNMPFDSVDVDKDKVIDIQDIQPLRSPFNDTLMQKIAEGNGAWVWDNYYKVTIDWFRAHFTLEPNKTRLLRVDIPIHIFHGTVDANVPVSGVYDLEHRFMASAKSNLTLHIFEDHNHDLNFQDWLLENKFSEGLREVFESAGTI